VPRVFDKIHNGINDRIAGASCVKKFLFKWAYGGKLSKLKAGYPSAKAAPFWDKIVFSKVRVQFCQEQTQVGW
jgi:long-chain acyl-CoA synthetase